MKRNLLAMINSTFSDSFFHWISVFFVSGPEYLQTYIHIIHVSAAV